MLDALNGSSSPQGNRRRHRGFPAFLDIHDQLGILDSLQLCCMTLKSATEQSRGLSCKWGLRVVFSHSSIIYKIFMRFTDCMRVQGSIGAGFKVLYRTCLSMHQLLRMAYLANIHASDYLPTSKYHIGFPPISGLKK